MMQGSSALASKKGMFKQVRSSTLPKLLTSNRKKTDEDFAIFNQFVPKSHYPVEASFWFWIYARHFKPETWRNWTNEDIIITTVFYPCSILATQRSYHWYQTENFTRPKWWLVLPWWFYSKPYSKFSINLLFLYVNLPLAKYPQIHYWKSKYDVRFNIEF